ncbi:putative reverse transcriptase zinc-binding domain-containing protein [Helianthus annuus]|nr:putative reverse transcriptase zinc-binding domain-containing protein [Helianthus annuus]
MLAKWWWRFKGDGNGLWRRVVWAIHHNSRAWNPVPAKLTMAGPWKQVARSVQELKEINVDVMRSIRGVLGNGEAILFWLDSWVSEAPLAVCFPALFALEKDKFCSVKDRVGTGANGVSWTWDWRRQPGDGLEFVEWQQLLSLMGDPLLAEHDDDWKWTLDGSGIYTVRSVKEALQNIRYVRPDSVFRWNSWVPKKVEILSWRAEQDRVPTRAALGRRNINIPSLLCPICGTLPETDEHLFVSCGFAQSVWAVISQWCKQTNFFCFRR